MILTRQNWISSLATGETVPIILLRYQDQPIQNKKISSLALWLEASNILIRGMTQFNSNLAPQMLVYQESMCTFMRAYPFEDCYRYDVATRLNIASNVNSCWDVLFDYAFNPFIRCTEPAGRVFSPTCYKCSKRGHYASNCPQESFVPQQRILNRAEPSPAGDTTVIWWYALTMSVTVISWLSFSLSMYYFKLLYCMRLRAISA